MTYDTPDWLIAKNQIPYQDAITEMENRVQKIYDETANEAVWFLQHPPLYTAGTSAKQEDLLNPRFPVFEAGRGGEYTYHGPGQLIGYTMLHLGKRDMKDLRRYVWLLEEWLITTLAHYNIDAQRRDGRVGLWITHPNGKEDKIAAIGVRVRKWITYHGFSLNISPDLSHFNGIVPCGIKEHGVTSFQELGIPATQEQIIQKLKETFLLVFNSES